jgi:hypothetical protein
MRKSLRPWPQNATSRERRVLTQFCSALQDRIYKTKATADPVPVNANQDTSGRHVLESDQALISAREGRIAAVYLFVDKRP